MDGPNWDKISTDAKDIILNCIVIDPEKRILMTNLINHKWFQNTSTNADI